MHEDLVRAIEARSATVAIIGQGYVGLPLALAFADAGFPVLGLDTDAAKVAALNEGRSYIRHIDGAEIARHRQAGRFEASGDFARLAEAEAILLCVPTPLNRHREPDMSFVAGTAETVGRQLRRGQLVVLESTTYPGTSRDVMLPALQAGGLAVGRDFMLAYSPEREDPGNPQYRTVSIPKVVGADDTASRQAAEALYRALGVQVVPVSSLAAAEAVKLTENIFRAVNIALVNELKVVFTRMGINVWEVIAAASTKPFGYMPFYPGPGLGGHCIPIDPFYLTWKAREFEVATRFIELAGEINTSMPAYVVDRLAEALDMRFRQPLNGARILLVGLAYKKNVDDVRESPTFRIMQLLERRGAAVDYFDPYVPVIGTTREYPQFAGRASVEWTAAALSGYDAAIICTDHDAVDYGSLARVCPLVVDTRNATGLVGGAGNVIGA